MMTIQECKMLNFSASHWKQSIFGGKNVFKRIQEKFLMRQIKKKFGVQRKDYRIKMKVIDGDNKHGLTNVLVGEHCLCNDSDTRGRQERFHSLLFQEVDNHAEDLKPVIQSPHTHSLWAVESVSLSIFTFTSHLCVDTVYIYYSILYILYTHRETHTERVSHQDLGSMHK